MSGFVSIMSVFSKFILVCLKLFRDSICSYVLVRDVLCGVQLLCFGLLLLAEVCILIARVSL